MALAGVLRTLRASIADLLRAVAVVAVGARLVTCAPHIHGGLGFRVYGSYVPVV